MRRRKRKKNKIVLVSFISLLFFFSVGYSSFSSTFLINGKGTIIENSIKVSELEKLVVTSGSGLYEDEYEEGRYIYRGTNIDNYILLGSDMYRIISKENDGTLKIIKNSTIGRFPFDVGYFTSIIGITNSSSVEGTRYSNSSSDYCYSSSISSYNDCKVWGNRTTVMNSSGKNVTIMPWAIEGTKLNLPSTESYINIYLNTTGYNSLSPEVKKVIESHFFDIGLVDSAGTNMLNSINSEKAYKWKGKIGLLNVSDYIRVSVNNSCVNVNSYWSNSNCYNDSNNHNWLFKDIFVNSYSPWLINPISNSHSSEGLDVSSGSGELATHGYVNDSYDIVPVFYLKSSIRLLGDVTETNPYTLAN